MHNTDGFFVAKLVKYDNVIPVDHEKDEEDDAIEKALEENRKAPAVPEEKEEKEKPKKNEKKEGKKEMKKDGKKEGKKGERKTWGKKRFDKEKGEKKEKRFGQKPRQFKDKPFKAQEGEKTANTQEVSGKEERKQIRDKKDGKKKFMMKQKKKE